jgi:hypothetical protein
MQRFKSQKQAQDFLSAHAFIHGHFHPRRNRMSATKYRRARTQAFKIWTQETCVQKAVDLNRPSQAKFLKLTMPFMMFAPLEGWRHIKLTDRRTAIDYAHALEPAPREIAICRDGSQSFSHHSSGTCSHHGGVAHWD